MNQPLISVIMVTHNRADLLPFAINSILSQSCKNFELIIINDHSTDETELIMKRFKEKDERIKNFHLEKNIGPGAARNFGIRHAGGKYIAILDDDDVSLPERLEVQSGLLENEPSASFIFSACYLVKNDMKVFDIFTERVHRGEFPEDPKKIFELFYLGPCDIVNSSIMFRRELVDQVGEYPEFPWTGEDRFFFMKVAAAGHRMIAVRRPLVYHRIDDQNPHLMKDLGKVVKNRLLITKMIQSWLKERNIKDFDHLHRRALSTALTREARNHSGFKGLIQCIWAFWLDPNNKYTQASLSWFFQKAAHKASRIITGGNRNETF